MDVFGYDTEKFTVNRAIADEMIHKHSGEEQVPQNKKKKIQKYGSNGTNKATTFDCP
jgi:hypothetical protein